VHLPEINRSARRAAAARTRKEPAGQHYEYLLRALTPEQIRGVADYLSRVSPNLSSATARKP